MERDLYTYSDAFKIGSRYIPEFAPTLPEFDRQYTRFEMTRESLQNTLSYIFHYLHHVCYMACIDTHGLVKMHKLVHKTTAPLFKEALKNALRALPLNPLLTEKQKREIAKTVSSGDWRIMQCIVKKYKKESAKDTDNVYLTLLKTMSVLPPGVFIFNLTDAVILRADGMHPFDSVVRELCPDEYIKGRHIPIFSLSGKIGYDDIVIPNYDDALYITRTKSEIAKNNAAGPLEIRWSHKIDCAVFRGGVTGCGTVPESNMRLRLAEMDDPPKLDVGIFIKNSSIVRSSTIRFDPIYGLSMINSTMPTKPRVDMQQQSRCKYIIHVDGNVHAYRFLSMMLTGSLTLRVESPYTSWMDGILKAYEHYVPIRSDLSNLHEILNWCRDNDTECCRIAKAGREAAIKALTRDYICAFIKTAMWNATHFNYAEFIADTAISLSTDEITTKFRETAKCEYGYNYTQVAEKGVCKKKKKRQTIKNKRVNK